MSYYSTGPTDAMLMSEVPWDSNNSTQVSVIKVPPTQDIAVWFKYILANVYVVMLIGLVLNLITAIAYVKSPLLSQGKPVHQVIFNMIISDITTCLGSQPFLVFFYTDAGTRYILGRKLQCIAALAGLGISFDSTMTALILITCERLFAISSPLQHMHRVTRKACRVVILITWAIIVVKNGAIFFWNKWNPYVSCVGITVMADNYAFYVYNFGLYIMIGLIVVLNVLLGVMVMLAKRNACAMNASQTTTKSMRRRIKSTQSELKIVKIVFLAVGVLVLTWIPHNTLANIALHYVTMQQAPPYNLVVAWHMTRGFVVCGTIADPLIYFLQNSGCHSAVLSLFGRSEAKTGRQQTVYTLDSLTQSKASEVTLRSDKEV